MRSVPTMIKKRIRVVGLTGGVGSGKSTAAAAFRARRIPVVDADQIVRRALGPRGAARSRVARLFGPGVVRGSGLDRKKIAAAVFSNPSLRRRLEGILHPLVAREIRRAIARRPALLVLDVPLLFESGLDRLADATLVIGAPWALRRRRLVRGGRMTASDARRRDAAQMPLAAKKRRADFVIDNRGSRADLDWEIGRFLEAIKK